MRSFFLVLLKAIVLASLFWTSPLYSNQSFLSVTVPQNYTFPEKQYLTSAQPSWASGKTVVAISLATWCAACEPKIRSLENAIKKYPNKFEIVLFGGYEEGTESILNYLKFYQLLKYPILYNSQIFGELSILGVPVVLALNSNKQVIYAGYTKITDQFLQSILP